MEPLFFYLGSSQLPKRGGWFDQGTCTPIEALDLLARALARSDFGYAVIGWRNSRRGYITYTHSTGFVVHRPHWRSFWSPLPNRDPKATARRMLQLLRDAGGGTG